MNDFSSLTQPQNGLPTPDQPSALGTLPTPPPGGSSQARRVGAGIGGGGALLILYGFFLPYTVTSQNEETIAPNELWLLLVMLLIPALLVLGISASPWFRKPWCWPVAIGCVVLILYVPVQQGYSLPMGLALLVLGISASAWFGEPNRWLTVLGAVLLLLAVPVTLFLGFLAVAFSCFDSCLYGPTHLGTGFWLPLMGFLLGGIGLIVVRRSAHQRTLKKAQAT